jgi:hypothetical protein
MASLKRRFASVAVALLTLLVLFTPGASAHAATTSADHLPFVNNFATARFKLLTTIAIEKTKAVSYGAGATVMPDRTSLWETSDDSDKIMHIIQIGRTIYQRAGDGAWEQNDVSVSDIQFQPLSAQFNQLQQFADAIYDMGPAMVGSTPTEQYQVWISGARAMEMSGTPTKQLPKETRKALEGMHFKYDFWIGTQGSFLYQQNEELLFAAGAIADDAPAMQLDVLMTFFDINDPNISVNAPI